ncbi:MAG: FAD-dependent oxidoreductase [Deltaproteobacteria bacterium]|nr:FAD-dependent oxidoreductase [Deltaproteobacteria bacterium]MBW2071098.1 FAD-dependent oxidoreductase [Deltaproteobacteria bacterium]
MKEMFTEYALDGLQLVNRFVFPPIKTGYGSLDGKVTERQLQFYRQIAQDGPAIIIVEPAAVTANGREHPRQLSIHQPHSVEELTKIVQVIHHEGRLACLHLNHAGAAANPKVTGVRPKAPSAVTCSSSGQTAEALTEAEIAEIVEAYQRAANRGVLAGFDLIELQAGHGYLLSQFLNSKINQRQDRFGKDRQLFVREVLSAVQKGAGGIPLVLRISGNEMSPEFGIPDEELLSLLNMIAEASVAAVHVGMGSACFSPPWYFHHMSLPEKPQLESLSRLQQHCSLPVIAAGRFGRKERIQNILSQNLADLIALGRPLIADPNLLKKWLHQQDDRVIQCGYCLQGCLHRVRSGEGLGCNVNPQIGQQELTPSPKKLRVLVAGGGPAGISAALYLAKRGHQVTLAEKEPDLGGQFSLACKAPGKSPMHDSLASLIRAVKQSPVTVLLATEVDSELVRKISPEFLVWATGAHDTIPDIPGLSEQHHLSALEYYRDERQVRGPRILVIGAGRTGLEIAEKLGLEGYIVVATKRTDPLGSNMEMVTRKLVLNRISAMENVTLMPRTRVKAFTAEGVAVETAGEEQLLEPFQTVIHAFGLTPCQGPGEEIKNLVPLLETIGDAQQVQDIYTATLAGYQLACKY